MNDRWSDRLSDYLDDDLDAAERASIETHLAVCDDCARTLEALREVAARTRTLENRAPAEDLWPAIRARVVADEPAVLRPPASFWPRPLRLTVPQAIAAGFTLMLLSGGSVWWVLRGNPQGAGLTQPGARSTAPASSSLASSNPWGGASGSSGVADQTGGTRAAFDAGPAGTRPAGSNPGSASTGARSSDAAVAAVGGYDTNYDLAVAELERTLSLHRSELDTSTVRVVEQNLAIIDRAILQARRALEADPASPYLHQHLALQMKLKLELLRRTTALAAAQG